MRLFGRQDELAKLATWVDGRRSFLFYGPSGVGKTRLVDELVPRFPDVVRVSSCNTPRALFQRVALTLWNHRHPAFRNHFKSAEQIETTTLINLKGVCVSILKAGGNVLLLEHLGFTSLPLSGAVKQLSFETGMPVIFVSRSCHMEDAGYLVRLYPERIERLELAPFNHQKAAEFANLVADDAGLQAENRTEFLARVVQLSDGNPGAIAGMIKMACTPKYRSEGRIKSTLLYIDFRLAKNASLSSL